LILLVLDELVVRQSRSSRLVGIGLGLLAAAQYMISTEIFSSMLLIAGFGVVVLMLMHTREIRSRARHALDGLGWAVLVCGAIVGYPVYLALHGPDRLADLGAHLSSISSDLLSSVVPDASQRFSPSTWATLGNRLALGNLAENDGYLGIPLLVLLVAAVVRYRRRGVIAFAAIMMLLAEILSFGPRLTVDTHTTSVPLLMAALDRFPILDSLVDSRLALYVNLFAAVILSVSVDQLRRELLDRASERRPSVGRHQRRSPIRWRVFAMAAIVAVALIPLVPRWPNRSSAASLPRYFSTAAFERVSPGSVALTYPYPDYPTLSSMLWQAGTSLRFRIIGGYALAPGVDGQPVFRLFPPVLQSVPLTLIDDYIGGSLTPTQATPTQIRAFLIHYGVETVFSESVGAKPKAADALFTASLGPPSTKDGRMDVWYDVAKRLVGSHSP
jgi:cytochrome bd-type quinol oxidase subunit 2